MRMPNLGDVIWGKLPCKDAQFARRQMTSLKDVSLVERHHLEDVSIGTPNLGDVSSGGALAAGQAPKAAPSSDPRQSVRLQPRSSAAQALAPSQCGERAR